MTGGSFGTATDVAERGHRFATILGGWNAQKLFDAYRGRRLERRPRFPGAGPLRLLRARRRRSHRGGGPRRAEQVAGYFRTTSIVGEAFVNPPGYMPPQGNAQWLKRNQTRGRAGSHFPVTTRDGRLLRIGSGHGSGDGVGPADLVDAGIAFTGTPDQVYDQIVELDEHVGGIGNLLIMAHGGDMSHADAIDNLTLFATEVLPRLRERDQSRAVTAAMERVAAAQV